MLSVAAICVGASASGTSALHLFGSLLLAVAGLQTAALCMATRA